MDIADTFPEAEGKEKVNWKQKYRRAAQRFRLPYWDPLLVRFLPSKKSQTWQAGIPKILGSRKVRVRYPKSPSYRKEVDNPLYAFKFVGSRKYEYDKQPPFNWKGWWQNRPENKLQKTPNKQTLRAPDKNGRSNNRKITARASPDKLNNPLEPPIWLSQQARTLCDLLNYQPDPTIPAAAVYGFFSNTAYDLYQYPQVPLPAGPTPPPRNMSIESFHNSIHELVGQRPDVDGEVAVKGHMADPPYSSFDPIFWLHHW